MYIAWWGFFLELGSKGAFKRGFPQVATIFYISIVSQLAQMTLPMGLYRGQEASGDLHLAIGRKSVEGSRKG